MCDNFTYIYMEKEECIICLEALDSSIPSACSECQYNVHRSCWNQWIRHQRINRCLICRKQIDTQPVYRNDGIVLCLTTICLFFLLYSLYVLALFHIIIYFS